jgi:UMF1 family MFS transporter
MSKAITPEEKQHRSVVRAWTMYDWANSAFATTIMAAVLPIYYATLGTPGDSPAMMTSRWGFTTALAALIAAVISPILGAVADFRGSKKKFLGFFMVLGVLATALLFLPNQPGDWFLASVIFVFANIGFAGSLVYYDALLPHVARADEIDQVSSKGYMMGYIGGGLLLAINLVMIMFLPGLIPALGKGLMTRLSFVTVAVWWFVFSLPLFLRIREPARRIEAGEENMRPIQASLKRLGKTFSDLKKYRDLSMGLLAFWIYSNGIGTIITMATAYGKELQFSDITLIGTLLMVQFLAAPFAFLFGWLSKRMGLKKSIFLSLSIYSLIAIAGYFMYHEWQFWVLGAAVATVQGGSQALSRSMIGRMMPKSKSAEFYGFFSVFEKFASILGPAIFGVISRLMNESRLSIASLIVFFGIGIFILTKVNIERGMSVAQKEEAEMVTVG